MKNCEEATFKQLKNNSILGIDIKQAIDPMMTRNLVNYKEGRPNYIHMI